MQEVDAALQLMGRYGLDPQRCVFVNFEDPRLAGQLDHTVLQALVDAFQAQRPVPACYFFDEIQRVDGRQRWLRGQLDRPRDLRFVVTGSNAHLLSGELASTLTGRHHRVELFPFDLDEFRALRPGASLADHLAAGGFPAPATSQDAERLLRSYFNDIVERDVRERVGARSSQPLRHLVQMLYESAGSELSVRRVAAALSRNRELVLGQAPDLEPDPAADIHDSAGGDRVPGEARVYDAPPRVLEGVHSSHARAK